jgi:hypothetical protein
VLTVSDIQFHSYDYELLAESVADNIYRTKSVDLMSILKKFKKKSEKVYFNTPERYKKIVRGMFPIDDKIGWHPYAVKKAMELIKKNNYDFIVATIGPLTSGLIAHSLHKKTQIPYYIDYRDHMTLHAYPQYINKLLFKHAQRFEQKMLKRAKGVFVIGNLMKQLMVDNFGQYLSDKIQVVYNGYDEDDFAEPIVRNYDQQIRIRYVGNIYGNRSIENFISVVEQMIINHEIPLNVTIEFVGNLYIETLHLLNKEVLKPFINIIPQQTHSEAVKLIRTADLLLLFISTKDRNDFVPGKIFEYIRAEVPILAMIPEGGEVADIFRSLGHKYICNEENSEKIREFLYDFIHSTRTHEVKKDTTYSRENQTLNMIKVLKNNQN